MGWSARHGGGTPLSQHSGGRSKRFSMTLRPAWSIYWIPGLYIEFGESESLSQSKPTNKQWASTVLYRIMISTTTRPLNKLYLHWSEAGNVAQHVQPKYRKNATPQLGMAVLVHVCNGALRLSQEEFHASLVYKERSGFKRKKQLLDIQNSSQVQAFVHEYCGFFCTQSVRSTM